MINVSKNIIEKINLEINTISEDRGMQLERQSSDLFQQKILPTIEKLLDEFGATKNIRLDKLAFEIDVTDTPNFEEQFLQQFLKQFAEALKNAPFENSKTSQKTEDLLIFFLENGHFPWWAQEATIEQLEFELIQSNQSRQAFLKWLKNNPKKVKRFVFQFSDKTLQETINQLVENSNLIFEYRAMLQKNLSKYYNSTEVRSLLWLSIFEVALNKKQPIEAIKMYVFIEAIQYFSQLEKVINDKIISKDVLTDLVLNEFSNEANAFILKLKKAALGIKKDAESIDSKTKVEFATEVSEITKPTTQDHQEWYIKNAGLILLHPFIAMLFESLGLTKKHVFKNTYSKNQAALLLQYLVTGKNQIAENELILNKVLCGIPLSNPIEKELLLNDQMVAETNQLLNAVIKHWTVLKNTSPDGLRNTFLHREGKLTKNNDGSWKLFIQHTAFDVLISKLPWSIAIIKLPWMKNMLQVEWA